MKFPETVSPPPAVMAPVLELRDLSVRLPATGDRPFAIENVSFTIRPGEVLCVVGESGSGKSVTAAAVMGLLPPGVLRVDSGKIIFDERDLTRARLDVFQQLRGDRMAMIFQEPMTALNPMMRVGDQIAESFQFHRKSLSRNEVAGRVLELLKDVRLPDPPSLRHAYPHQLSGGQRQRVMIAMALAMAPSLLIADEPTTALDVTSQAEILRLLNELRRRHRNGVLLITHDFDVVSEIADSVVVMQHGKIVESGSARAVLDSPRHPYTKQLIAAVPKGVFGAGFLPSLGDPVLQVSNLNLRYHTKAAFRSRPRVVDALLDVSVSLMRGETLGIVGESGSGKTTLGRCMSSFATPTAGRILLEGKDMSTMSVVERLDARKRIQMIFQDPFRSFNPRLRVKASLAEGPRNFGASARQVESRMLEMLDLVKIDAAAIDRFPHEFSGGQRQRLSIARALMMEPSVLVADEAVSALDVSVQAQIIELLEDVRERLGLSIVFITHDLRIAARLCHRIAVMQQGRIVELASARQVFREPRCEYTKELLAAIPGRRTFADSNAGIADIFAAV